MWGHSEEMAGDSPDSRSGDTLTSDFQPPESGENSVCCLAPPVYGISVQESELTDNLLVHGWDCQKGKSPRNTVENQTDFRESKHQASRPTLRQPERPLGWGWACLALEADRILSSRAWWAGGREPRPCMEVGLQRIWQQDSRTNHLYPPAQGSDKGTNFCVLAECKKISILKFSGINKNLEFAPLVDL